MPWLRDSIPCLTFRNLNEGFPPNQDFQRQLRVGISMAISTRAESVSAANRCGSHCPALHLRWVILRQDLVCKVHSLWCRCSCIAPCAMTQLQKSALIWLLRVRPNLSNFLYLCNRVRLCLHWSWCVLCQMTCLSMSYSIVQHGGQRMILLLCAAVFVCVHH